MEIIILTSIICTLFIVFIFGPLFFAHKLDKKRSSKKKMMKKITRTIADMESEGIYFSEEVKDELRKKREELLCQYSGLPSVRSYENQTKK